MVDQIISKPIEKYNEVDKQNLSLNTKAKNILYCVLDRNEFNRISTCDFAYDNWNALEITHFGTTKVNETKINLIVKDFENFFMKVNEPIVDISTHFTDIVNSLKDFDRTLINGELVSKVLKSLLEECSLLRMLIENNKDVITYLLEELYATLRIYELNRTEIKE